MLLRGKGHGGLIIHAAAAALDYPAIDASTAIGADCLWLADGAFPQDSNQVAASFGSGGSHTGAALIPPVSFASVVDLTPCSSAGGLTFEWEGAVSNRNGTEYPIDAQASDGSELASFRIRDNDGSLDIFTPETTWGWGSDGLSDLFIEDGTIHHYVIAVSPSGIDAYRDGSLYAHKTQSSAAFNYTQPTALIVLADEFDSAIHRAALYGRALTGAEAAALAADRNIVLSNS